MGTGKTYSTKYLLDSNNNRGAVGQVLSTTSTGIDWVNANTVPGAGLWLANGNDIYNSNSGNVGIGTSSTNAKLTVLSTSTTLPTLQIQGTGGYSFLAGYSDPYHGMIFRGIPSAATTYAVTPGDQISFLEYGGDFRFYEKSSQGGASGTLNEIARIHKTNSFFLSNVGIGVTGPEGKFDVVDGNAKMIFKAGSSDRPYLQLRHDAVPVDGEELALLDFAGFNDASQITRYGIIIGKAEDVSDGSEDGSMSFLTMKAGAATNTMVLRSGNVGMGGQTAPSQALDVSGKIRLTDDLQLDSTSPRLDYDNGAAGSLRLFSTSQNATKLSLTSAGALQLNAYNSTNQTGTPTYILGTDATGNVVKVLGGDIPGAGGTGTVTGTGTTSRLTKFTDGANGVIGDSILAVTADSLDFTNADFAQIKFKESGAIMIDSDNNQSSRNFQIKDGSGSSLLTVLDTGNVGIGTTSPLYPLNVSIPYAKTSTGTQQFAAIFTTNEAPASAPFGLRIGIIGAAAIANRYAALQTTDYNLADGGNIVMQAAGGNVAIGVTSNTTHKLIVSGGTNIASFRSEGSGQNLKKLSISTGGDRVVLDASTTTDATTGFAFQTGGTERMRISTSGAIRFNNYNGADQAGTPTYLLGTDLQGNVVKTLGGAPSAGGGTTSQSKYYTSLTGSSTDFFPLFTINDVMGPVNCKIFTYAHDCVEFSVAEGYGPSNAGSITIINSVQTANGNYATVEAVRIDQAGVVEVKLTWGVATPIVNIGVLITGYQVPNLVASLATGTSTATTVDSVGVNVTGILRSKNKLQVGGTSISDTTNTVSLNRTGNSYIVGNTADNFGVGTATPGAKLTVEGNSVGLAASFTNSDATNGYGVAIESEGTSATRYALIIRNLDSSNVYGGVSTGTNQVGFWGIGASPTNTLGSRLTVGGNTSIGSGYTGNSAPSNGLIVQGGVGIGTISPAATLHVASSSGFNGVFAVADTTVPASGAEYGFAMIKTASTGVALNVTSYSANGKGLRVYNNGTAAANTSFEVLQGNGSKFIVDGIGNVGINTTGPTEKLEVRGGVVRISDSRGNDSGILAFGNFLNGAGYYDNAVWRGALNTPTSSGNFMHMSSYSGLVFTTQSAVIGSQAIRMYIPGTGSNAGNVGIGTTSPADLLEIEGDADVYARIHYTGNGSNTPADVCGIKLEHGRATWNIRNTYSAGTGGSVGLFSISRNSNANALTIDSGTYNFVGIGTGTASPLTKLHIQNVNKNNDAYGLLLVENTDTDTTTSINSAANVKSYYGTSQFMQWESNGLRIGSRLVTNGGSGDLYFTAASDSVKMVLKSSGRLGIGLTGPSVKLDVIDSRAGSTFTTGVARFENTIETSSGGAGVLSVANNYQGGFGTLIKFYFEENSVASINFNASATAVVYNTTSDYRLKEDLKSFNGLEIIDQIKTYNYKWKKADARGYGALAHELQEVFPDAVTGDKDGEDMQGVDYSTLVPVLIKSIQELKVEIELLKQQINN